MFWRPSPTNILVRMMSKQSCGYLNVLHYDSSPADFSLAVTVMNVPPPGHRLDLAFDDVKAEFDLTEEQSSHLPVFDEVDLVPQSESHLIKHSTLATYTYHPYKLFIGEHKKEPIYAYLYRTGARKQFQIELCGVEDGNNSHQTPMVATYYGTVDNLAYPFNSFLGTARFVAVVKWYFLIGLRLRVFDDDPGFSLSASWRRDLQGACNDLIAAEESEAQVAREKEARRPTKNKRVQDRKRKDSLERPKHAPDLRRANSTTTKLTVNSQRHAGRSAPQTKPTPMLGPDGSSDREGRKSEQPLRRSSRQPHRAPDGHDFGS